MSSPPRDGGASGSATNPRSPGVNQPFIYPIRSAVSVKPPSEPHTPGTRRSTERVGSASGTDGSHGSGTFFDLRNRPEDVDRKADHDLGQFRVPDSEGTGTNGTRDLRDKLEAMTTRRFEHVETPEGHMILTGREGELARCEDEPIHAPGAVQSFGCMIVINVDRSGQLIVRQASENTGDVLGLSPAYLFSLQSFADVFDEDQAELLWDNIDTLDEGDQDLSEAGPSVFQLHGSSMATYDKRRERDPESCTTWNAWCAAHVPERSGGDDDDGEMTVILEFELVDDPVNPIASSSRPPSPSFDEAARTSGTSTGGTTTQQSSPPPSISTVDSDGTVSSTVYQATTTRSGLEGQETRHAAEDLRESTQTIHRPLKALSRMRRNNESEQRRTRSRRPGVLPGSGNGDGTGGMLDMFGVLSQVNEQLSAQTDLTSFLKVLVGIVRDITLFSRVMVYQFDEAWNGQVVCELVDWSDTNDLYRGLHFPATDIPAQARALYKINKVRLLYDRDQQTARMVCRDASDLETPIDMTHGFLRAMSPIHLKYLANMQVRSSMSISIVAFGELWGLISLHNYGARGRRVSFPIRQLCRLIGESVSRNIERLSYTRRLSARKLINTLPTDQNPSGYIISNAEDLLTLFDADFGVIAIGNEAKILGPLSASQEVLAVTEYLRIKKFEHLVTSQDVRKDFPDMVLPTGLEVIAGLLLVPLSGSGVDFIAFLRKAQLRHVNWAGKPFKQGMEARAMLEPRKSFKVWSETVQGTCRAWKDEELETASVLCLVYGKFISVWRQREQALHYNQLNRLLLSNASHEVRTPLNHIINYLELALDSRLDEDTRENLSKSHMASKSLLFVINDLLDLTKQEQGNKLFLQEPFDLAATVREAVEMHEWEAKRRRIDFTLVTEPSVCRVLGDRNRVRQVVTNIVTNSVKYTTEGHIHVSMKQRPEDERSEDLPQGCNIEIELIISDTGEGIPREKLEAIFREFEQVESVIAEPGRGDGQDLIEPDPSAADAKPDSGIGLGLAIVARIVKNLGGQLRVDSTVGEGSTFTFYIPFCSATDGDGNARKGTESLSMRRSNSLGSGSMSSNGKSEIDSLVEAIREPILRDPSNDNGNGNGNGDAGSSGGRRSIENGPAGPRSGAPTFTVSRPANFHRGESQDGMHQVEGSGIPVRSVKVEPQTLDADDRMQRSTSAGSTRRKSSAEAFKEAVQSRDHEPSQAGRRASNGGAQEVTPCAQAADETLAERRDQAVPDMQLPQASAADGSAVAVSDESPSVELPETPPSGGSRDGAAKGERRSSSSAQRRRLQNVRSQLKNQAAAGSPTPEKLAPLRVLVVEDDPINRMILKKRLGMDGHTVLQAVNGEEGVRQFEKDANEIDCILMDLQMPICNGQEACKRIRQCEQTRSRSGQISGRPPAQILNGRVPILAVSATLTHSMREEMTEIGMDGWVLKPIDFGRLSALMRGLLHTEDRKSNQWEPGYVWEKGGWLSRPASRPVSGGGETGQ
ncbi:uncharacterized protein PFL1_04512 [Pseudozyma flocculosa PF-1]|uniref:Related to phytochrome n=2 Tax=Pseudozyma flocculosa TaxID=84751 RepID=A0A5C3F9I3_9BASI|nr:uncharacterized protein PFL1_04512 [Pseudozyma flocculosa PF-1]EPQ27766.1 hypothetical protein PFL1_04512 [Pseudozyma flocculosa PF-1]SPO41108.1 related to phytochrome [Pseudozyma flocculosa]